MPDWSYQTLFRPILFRLPVGASRDLALGAMGLLARLPLGTAVIRFMGHMAPDPRLSHTAGEIEFAGRVGLGASVDPELRAPAALSRMGVAFLEVGPLSPSPPARSAPIGRILERERLTFDSPRDVLDATRAARALREIRHIPIFVRVDLSGTPSDADRDRLLSLQCNSSSDLSTRAAAYLLTPDRWDSLPMMLSRLREETPEPLRKPMLAVLKADEATRAAPILQSCFEQQLLAGVLVEGETVDDAGHRVLGAECFPALIPAVRALRGVVPDGAILAASGGVHEPQHALELLDAGANLVSIDSGMIFSGPGLPKRINEAMFHRQSEREPPPAKTPERQTNVRPTQQSWFWTALIGAAMFLGGIMAMIIATTRVVMPYDEAMAGLTREQIVEINDRLLHFMTHDRVTLSGTMLAVGILYLVLSWYGSRRGMHWAHVAIIASSLAGFTSFFLFLGFGYFDPFHAFVTAVMLQPVLLAMHSDLPEYRHPVAPELTNDRAWRLSQWGQLIFIGHGAVLIVAGCVISSVGISHVFVHEDLEFMHTTAEHLFDAHPRLVPLVAHDRATFGGMLISCGVCVFLSSLWGFRRGNAWLWWALVTAGTIAYVATICVHWHVGYTSLMHLLPAYAGLAMIAVGGALSYGHLCPAPGLRL
ncbi:MAG: hypothetical protein IT428_20755 [Planctomycetaceae bacterium]|nr:hypothetical protein [Planctomycetaceae bacterium]